MKKIGFIDYFIDEWHSSNYIPWLKEICEEKGLRFEVKYGWAEVDQYEGKISTGEWCEKFGVEWCKSLQEVCEKSDYIMILAPGNPERHLGLAEKVLPFGKNTYIDKTFAPDLETAKQIFEIAEKHNTKFFSSSALRYSTELDDLKDYNDGLIVSGGGRSLEEYSIHQIEMLVKHMGMGAKRVKAFAKGNQKLCNIEFDDGRYAFMVYAPSMKFVLDGMAKDGTTKRLEASSPYFKLMLADIMRFFESGETSFDTAETLEIMAIRDAVLKATYNPDTWVEIER